MKNENNTVFIYGLIDPREPKLMRYIGKTKRSLKTRLIEHISQATYQNRYCSNWIRGLLKYNIKPEIILIEVCEENCWEDREKHHIKLARINNNKLTNFEDGGKGGKILHTNRVIKKRNKKTSKTVIQMDLSNQVLNTYRSCSEIEKLLGFNRHVIAACCRGKQTKAYGFRWVYKNNPNIARFTKKHTKSVKIENKITKEETFFESITACVNYLKLPRNYVNKVLSKQIKDNTYNILFINNN